MNPRCAEAISAYLERAGHGNQTEAFLFQPVKNGKADKPMRRCQIYRLFTKYGRMVGLDPILYPHSARATFATHAYEKKIPGEDILKSLGHSSITTTEGYNPRVLRKKKV